MTDEIPRSADKLRVLLIDTSADFTSRAGHSFDVWIHQPLALIYLATYLQRHWALPHQTKIINLGVDCKTYAEIGGEISRFRPDVVGLRGLSTSKEQLHSSARVVRERSSATIVAGGPYPSASPLDVLLDENIDFAVQGEGEVALLNLLDHIHGGEPEISEISGLCYRTDGGEILVNPSTLIEDLDQLPLPDYSLIDVDTYSRYLPQTPLLRRYALLNTTRGCPYKCVYCHRIMQKKFRRKSAQNVVEEIAHLREYHSIQDFLVIDDAFANDVKRGIEIFNGVVRKNLDVRFYFSNGLRGDVMTREFVDAMVEAGAVQVVYAPETGSPRLQKYLKKRMDLDKLARIIEYTINKRIIVDVFTMVGFPTESEEEARATLEYVLQFRYLCHVLYFVVRYFKGTELYDLAIESGLSPDDLNQDESFSYHDVGQLRDFLSPSFVHDLRVELTRRLYLSKERLSWALGIQRRYLREEEIFARYKMAFPSLKNLQEFEQLAS